MFWETAKIDHIFIRLLAYGHGHDKNTWQSKVINGKYFVIMKISWERQYFVVFEILYNFELNENYAILGNLWCLS